MVPLRRLPLPRAPLRTGCSAHRSVGRVGRRPTALSLAAAWALASLSACGRGESASERQLNQLRDEIQRVQMERERMDERLAALEASKPPPGVDANPSSADLSLPRSDGEPDTPRLRVVRLGPETAMPAPNSATMDAATDDPTPRPTVRAQGKPRETSGPEARVVVRDDGDVPPPNVLDPRAKSAYDSALGLVRERKYDAAIEALAAFLVRFPDHPYAENALYWRGEALLAKGDVPRAAEQFRGAIARFPAGRKVPDALLKLAMCESRLGRRAEARAASDRLKREFPDSEAAQRAVREVSP